MQISHAEEFRQHCLDDYPREAVGIIRDNRYIRVHNRADDPEQDFSIRASELLDATHLLHSHSRSETPHPTLRDILTSNQWPQVIFGLTTCDGKRTGEIVLWGRRAPIAPFVGRTFLFFIRDCAQLVTDYYRQQGYDFPDWPREPYWWENGQDLWQDALRDLCFERVTTPEVGDVMLTRLNNQTVPVHGGVIVGPNEFLHHPQGYSMSANRLSRIDPLRIWQRYLHSYWRPPAK